MDIEKIRPIKQLGQNFLQNSRTAKKIVELLGDIKNKNVYEIGPGMGALTSHLINAGAILTAFDVDERAIKYLNEKYSYNINFKTFLADIRDIKLDKIDEKTISIIGNIPYNITNDILFWLMDNSFHINYAVLTIQREVAERYVAKVNTKQYGITTLAIKLYANAKIAFHIPAGAFFPKPKVNSSVIFLDFSDKKLYENINKSELIRFIRAAFSQRRKILSNSLKAYFDLLNIDVQKLNSELLKSNKTYLKCRAEQLTLDNYIDFFDFIYNNKISIK